MTPRAAAAAFRVRTALLLLWAAASFGVALFARDLDQTLGDWPLNFWLAAQGGVLVFIGIVAFYAWYMNRRAPGDAAAPDSGDTGERPDGGRG